MIGAEMPGWPGVWVPHDQAEEAIAKWRQRAEEAEAKAWNKDQGWARCQTERDQHRIAREILRERLGASEAQVAALRSALIEVDGCVAQFFDLIPHLKLSYARAVIRHALSETGPTNADERAQ